ncbi:MAG TPA: hypothetical protein VMV77_13450 [Bacteroidales bacterium]|nr:hypothetical protein [Bacteroidales bacterium]
MKKEITIEYDPESRPQVEISAPHGSDPKEDMLILCDAITCIIKILHANDIQKDEISMAKVSDRINAGYINGDIRAESVTTEPESEFTGTPAAMPADPKMDFLSDMSVAVNKQIGKIHSGDMVGMLDSIKFDIQLQHAKRMGLL